jgi:hypothetical protein
MKSKIQYTVAFLKAAGLEANPEEIKNYHSIFWLSTRDKDVGGLRLSEEGINFVKDTADIKIYQIPFPNDLTLSPQILIWLDQQIECPYYIEKKKITVLSERVAFELYMFSGDIKKMGSSKAMAKAFSQD